MAQWKEDRPMNNGSKGAAKMTAGLDLGDKYGHLCLIETESGEVIEEGRLRTTPEAIRRRFDSEQPLRIAIEVGTHSPWVSRLLEECGHQVLVANARKLHLIYARASVKVTSSTRRIWPGWPESIPSSCIRSSTEASNPRLTWRFCTPAKCSFAAVRS
jgi:hypothetical protein